MSEPTDLELTPFEAKLLRSAEQVARSEYGRIHTPEDILARRAASGEAVNAQTCSDPVPLDPEVVSAFQAVGSDWQARINDVLKDWLKSHSPS